MGEFAMFARIMRSVWRNNEGSALVEATVLVPVFCLLVFGVFEFSWIFDRQHLISTGVQDAARYLARASTPTDATLKTYAQNLAVTGSTDGSQPLRVAGWVASNVTISFPATEIVQVSTTFTVPQFGFFGFLGLTPPALTVSHQERTGILIKDAP